MTASFWDKRSKKYDENIRKHNETYNKTIEKTKKLVTDSDSILDLGCASGEMSLDLASNVKFIHGIDLSGKMIELAKTKIKDKNFNNIKFSQGDIFDQSLEKNSYQAILTFNIFHLLDDIPKSLHRIHELLVPDGLLISQTPCLGERRMIFKVLISFIQKIGMAPPILDLNYPMLESTISNGNFKIIEKEILDQKNGILWIVGRKT
jgi:ubiquinone/menaquinone biosynthesis C-methylase UbiE